MSLVSTKIARAHRLSDSHARPSPCANIQCKNIGLYRTGRRRFCQQGLKA